MKSNNLSKTLALATALAALCALTITSAPAQRLRGQRPGMNRQSNNTTVDTTAVGRLMEDPKFNSWANALCTNETIRNAALRDTAGSMRQAGVQVPAGYSVKVTSPRDTSTGMASGFKISIHIGPVVITIGKPGGGGGGRPGGGGGPRGPFGPHGPIH